MLLVLGNFVLTILGHTPSLEITVKQCKQIYPSVPWFLKVFEILLERKLCAEILFASKHTFIQKVPRYSLFFQN
jgi:hypothetical protein